MLTLNSLYCNVPLIRPSDGPTKSGLYSEKVWTMTSMQAVCGPSIGGLYSRTLLYNKGWMLKKHYNFMILDVVYWLSQCDVWVMFLYTVWLQFPTRYINLLVSDVVYSLYRWSNRVCVCPLYSVLLLHQMNSTYKVCFTVKITVTILDTFQYERCKGYMTMSRSIICITSKKQVNNIV